MKAVEEPIIALPRGMQMRGMYCTFSYSMNYLPVSERSAENISLSVPRQSRYYRATDIYIYIYNTHTEAAPGRPPLQCLGVVFRILPTSEFNRLEFSPYGAAIDRGLYP
jgi:hypothetical protein